MKKKIPVTWIVLVGLMSSITLGVLFDESKADDSTFVFGSAHEHASITVRIFGDEFDFTKPEFQLQSSFIHLENSDGYVIHRHSKDVTIGYLFETLNLGLLSDCIIFPDGTKFCSIEYYTLKFYINGKKVDDLRDYLIFEGDLILISYGSENQEEVAEQLAELKSRGFPFKLREKNDNYLSKF
ncbi:MAG: protein-disulfide isomerase [Nitrosopumilaceae archaeon]